MKHSPLIHRAAYLFFWMAAIAPVSGCMNLPRQAEPVPGLNLIIKQADEGLPPAQNQLGEIYYNGLGVPQDLPRAFSLFQAAAMQNYAPAQYNLGLAYLNGQGVQANMVEGCQWLSSSASLGFDPAMAAYQNNCGF